MIVGYARTSTLDQTAGIEAQRRDLAAAGCEKIFEEQVSSVDMTARRKLVEALDYLRDGDTLVVTRLDRLARSVGHLMELLDVLKDKDVNGGDKTGHVAAQNPASGGTASGPAAALSR